MATVRPKLGGRQIVVVLMFAVAVAAGACVAFCTNFSQFKAYDDEGYCMRSVQSYLDGHVLYDEVYTQYGPVYFIWKSFWHRLTGWPVSHDMVRITTLLMWVGSSLLMSLASFRTTKSLRLASAVYLLTFLVVGNFSNESGHPQEFCSLLLAALAYSATFLDTSTKKLGPLVAFGALLALLLLTKVNVGIYAGLAMTGTLLSFAPQGKLRSAAGVALLCVAVMFPVAMMRAHLTDEFAQNYIAVTTLSIIAALCVTLFGARSPTISIKPVLVAAVTFLLVSAGVLLIVFANGTSYNGFMHGILGQHLKFVSEFFHPPKFIRAAVPLAVVSCFAALAYCIGRRSVIADRHQKALKIAGIVVRALLIACVCGLALFGDALNLLGFAVPWLWLAIAVPVQDELSGKQLFFRRFVALLVTFEVLQGYPIAGTQLSIATFPAIALVSLCGWDLLRKLQAKPAFSTKSFVLAGNALSYGALIAVWCWLGVERFETYQQQTPLGLPGAKWIRLKDSQVAELRCLVTNLRERCDTFISSPGLNSLYFWAQLEPPTHLNATVWTGLFDDAKQNKIIEELERRPKALFVRHERLDSIPRSNLDRQPLVQYLRRRYQTRTQVGQYELCSDTERRLPPLVEAATVLPAPARVASLPAGGELAPFGPPSPMFQIHLAKDLHPQVPVARVQIFDGRNERVFADSRRGGKLHLELLDKDLKPIDLPLSATWLEDESPILNIVPSEKWTAPKDFSRTFVRLLDQHGKTIAALPVAQSRTQ